MKKGFRRNISANTLQLIINQLFNLLTFYLLSSALPKQAFGELNWTLSVLLFAFTLASFGYDQIVIKKVAEGGALQRLLSLHFFHVVVAGCTVYVILLIAALLLPFFFSAHPLLLFLGLGKLLFFFSTPFKTIATGSERFRLLLYMSTSSAVLKGLCFLFLFSTNHLTLSAVLVVFILADVSEMLLGGFLTFKILRLPVQWHVNLKAYVSFCKAALPQVGIVIFASALARADWIMIGLFLSPAQLAEYSFAYKAFEICFLPLLVVAPLLVPWFTRIIKTEIPLQQHPHIQLLLRVEIIVACFVALCLNLLWNPFVDEITGGKYGTVNTRTIFILSMTLPVFYLNNFLWSLHFAYGNLRTILFSFILSFLLNVLGNILLLPGYGNEGAAVAYFLSILTQTLFYANRLREHFSVGMFALAACSLCAFLSGYLSPLFTANMLLLFVFGTALYIVFLVCTVQIHQKDLKLLWKIIKG